MTPPLIAGGQGKTATEVRESARVLTFLLICAVTTVAALLIL